MTDTKEKLMELAVEALDRGDMLLNHLEAIHPIASFMVLNGVTVAEDTNVLTKTVEAQRKKIAELEKSNRNWRRKAQRLRKRNAKEVE
jgi:uncharacterized protein YlxW (UPF0749 family)